MKKNELMLSAKILTSVKKNGCHNIEQELVDQISEEVHEELVTCFEDPRIHNVSNWMLMKYLSERLEEEQEEELIYF